MLTSCKPIRICRAQIMRGKLVYVEKYTNPTFSDKLAASVA